MGTLELKELKDKVAHLEIENALLHQMIEVNAHAFEEIKLELKEIRSDFKKLCGFWGFLPLRHLVLVLPLLGIGFFGVDKAYHKPSPEQVKYIQALQRQVER